MTKASEAVAERLDGFHAPQQDRSRRTLDRIARATEALLLEQGPAGVTVQEVVAAADTSVGAFYTRFESRDAAVAFVRERSWEEARERWREFLAPDAWKGIGTEAVVAEVIRSFCRALLATDRPTRSFYLDLLRRGEENDLERIRRLDREIAELVGRLLGPRLEGSGAVEPSRAAAKGFLRLISGLRDQLLFDPEGDERELILILTQMYSGLLGLEPPSSYRELLATCVTARRPA